MARTLKAGPYRNTVLEELTVALAEAQQWEQAEAIAELIYEIKKGALQWER